MNNDSGYIKQSVVMSVEQRNDIKKFVKLLRQHKLDISFSGVIRMLIEAGKKDVKFAVLDKQFCLEDMSNECM